MGANRTAGTPVTRVDSSTAEPTEREVFERALAASEARFRSLAELATDVVYRLTCSPLRFDYLSPSVASLVGRTPGEFYADPALLLRILHPDDIGAVLDALHPDYRNPRMRLRFRRPDGTIVHTEAVGRPLLDDDGAKIGIQGALRDITAQHELERELARLADEDPLTGLSNRRALFRSLAHRIDEGTPTSVVFIDLDAFKAVNDEHGHDAGDQVLHTVGVRLRAIAAADDLVARLAGDEFIVLCAPCGTGRAIDAMRRAIARPIVLAGGATVTMGASLGSSEVLVGDTPSSALARADGAMYAVKHGRVDA